MVVAPDTAKPIKIPTLVAPQSLAALNITNTFVPVVNVTACAVANAA